MLARSRIQFDDLMALLVSAFLVSFGPVTVDTTDAEALIPPSLVVARPLLSTTASDSILARL